MFAGRRGRCRPRWGAYETSTGGGRPGRVRPTDVDAWGRVLAALPVTGHEPRRLPESSDRGSRASRTGGIEPDGASPPRSMNDPVAPRTAPREQGSGRPRCPRARDHRPQMMPRSRRRPPRGTSCRPSMRSTQAGVGTARRVDAGRVGRPAVTRAGSAHSVRCRRQGPVCRRDCGSAGIRRPRPRRVVDFAPSEAGVRERR